MQNLLRHRLVQDNVLLLPVEFDSDDKVVISKSYDKKPEWGLVVSIGPGRLLENGELYKVDIKVGDVVLFMEYGATRVRSLGVDFLYVRQEDCISVYE